MRSKRRGLALRRLLVKFALLAMALIASDGAWAAPSALTPVRIEVPGDKNLQFFTLWVALGAGYFQQEGLEPKILVDATPRSAGQRLFQGKADVALLPPPMFLGMMAEDKPILLFASLLANEPINLALRKSVADARQVAAHAGLRERLQAIRGLRIGLAGEVAPRLRALFASAGMNADRDVQLMTIAGPDQVKAFADGRIDVLFAHTPYLETVLVQHGAVLLVDTSGGEVPILADGQIHALATTRALARTKPEMMAAVTRAIYRAEFLIHSDAKGTVDAILASGAAGQDRRMVEVFTAVYGPAVPRSPRISLEGIERDAALYPAHPRAPDFAKVKAADYVASQFADQAAKP
jgi:NitT/TauT family transport system substrate-binding protein